MSMFTFVYLLAWVRTVVSNSSRGALCRMPQVKLKYITSCRKEGDTTIANLILEPVLANESIINAAFS